MTKIIEQIIRDIERAPSTFINLAHTNTADDQMGVFGPMALGKGDTTPKYGFTDEVIAAVESGRYDHTINRAMIDFCGSAFLFTPEKQDGALALPLMMRLARAGVIRRKNYSEKWHLDTWSATTEAGAEMMTLVKRMRDSPSQVNLDIRRLLNPSSPVEAGRNLYTRITKGYI